jgi:hypothetical protein
LVVLPCAEDVVEEDDELEREFRPGPTREDVSTDDEVLCETEEVDPEVGKLVRDVVEELEPEPSPKLEEV